MELDTTKKIQTEETLEIINLGKQTGRTDSSINNRIIRWKRKIQVLKIGYKT